MRNLTMLMAVTLLWAAHAVRADQDNVLSYRVTTIDYPGFRGTTSVTGISDSERVIGAFSAPATQFTYGFVEFRGGFSLLPTAPCESAHCDTTPLAINSRGDVAGEFSPDATHRSV